jgi:hypothetical protein
MKIRTKIITSLAAIALGLGGVAACSSDADVASDNLSKAAENFEIQRRIVFYNGITGEYILVIEGRCSVEPGDGRTMTVTCKAKGNEFKKHFLANSDNVTWFAEQIEAKSVSTDHYKVNFKPQSIIPDVDKR